MFGSSLGRLTRTAVQIVFAISVLLSAPAQAQGLVGSWTESGVLISFQSSGRWMITVSDPVNAADCGGYVSIGGSYTTGSGNSISVSFDTATCGSESFSIPPEFLGSGSYTSSGNTLAIHLQGPYGPIDFNLSGNITRATPLPPPQTVQSVYVAKDGQIPPTAVQVTRAGTFGDASLSVTLDIVKVLQANLSTGFAADTYKVYVAALVPGAVFGSATPVWYVKPKAPDNWGPLRSPIAPFLDNVAQSAVNNQVVIDILSKTDISSLAGTEIYIGYGTSSDEMLAAKRYRGIYKAQ